MREIMSHGEHTDASYCIRLHLYQIIEIFFIVLRTKLDILNPHYVINSWWDCVHLLNLYDLFHNYAEYISISVK